MSYATITDLARLGVVPATLAGLSSETKEAALSAASSLASGYLQSQFALPLSEWGDDLRRAVVAIAVYDLLSHRGYDPEASGNLTIRDRYEDSVQWLRDVAAGRVSPSGIVDSTPECDDAGPVVVTRPKRGW